MRHRSLNTPSNCMSVEDVCVFRTHQCVHNTVLQVAPKEDRLVPRRCDRCAGSILSADDQSLYTESHSGSLTAYVKPRMPLYWSLLMLNCRTRLRCLRGHRHFCEGLRPLADGGSDKRSLDYKTTWLSIFNVQVPLRIASPGGGGEGAIRRCEMKESRRCTC